jgi:hypothetical protein
MVAARMRYELRVATLLSEAALATFRVPVRPTAMPRDTVYRFRVPADRDASELLHRLIECNVQVLEIRRCPEPSRRDRGTAQVRQEAPPPETGDPVATAVGVVIPFPVRTRPCPPGGDPAPGSCSSAQPGLDPDGGGSSG